MNLNFKVYGEGEPLVILHGLLGSLDNWQTLAKQYANHFTVFIVDQRNHGKSPHSDEFSYSILANDLLEFCEQHHLYNTHILGHSMGGKVAMQFAIENPDYINKLIIADIAPISYPPGHNEIFNALLNANIKDAESRSDVEKQIEQTIPNFGTRQFLMKGLTRAEDNSFAWKFNLQALWDNYAKIIGTFETEQTFNGPSLFINGANSNYVSERASASINTLFPNNIRKTIQGAGHWLHAEKPKEFFEKTQSFLEK